MYKTHPQTFKTDSSTFNNVVSVQQLSRPSKIETSSSIFKDR